MAFKNIPSLLVLIMVFLFTSTTHALTDAELTAKKSDRNKEIEGYKRSKQLVRESIENFHMVNVGITDPHERLRLRNKYKTEVRKNVHSAHEHVTRASGIQTEIINHLENKPINNKLITQAKDRLQLNKAKKKLQDLNVKTEKLENRFPPPAYETEDESLPTYHP